MSPPQGARHGFGALHLGAFRVDARGLRELVYAGRVGTGFTDALLEKLHKQLLASRRKTPPVSGPIPAGGAWPGTRPVGPDEVWVEPELVCEVRYKEWTEEGLLRQPAFLGMRDDKTIEECLLPAEREKALTGDGAGDVESDLAESDHATAASEDDKVSARDEIDAESTVAATVPLAESRTGARELKLSNRNKVFWPRDGYTKGDLIDYYRTIAPAMLPWLRDRPLVLTRLPDGIDGHTNFYQKNAPSHAPDWIQTETIWSDSSERDIEYFVVQERDALVYMANL